MARFEPCGVASAAGGPPPLFDAEVLACCTGEWMSVAGFECVAAGPLQDPTLVCAGLVARARAARGPADPPKAASTAPSGRVAELEVELERLRQGAGAIIRRPVSSPQSETRRLVSVDGG